MIDVGGPSMLRAAAKNFAHVAPVSRPEQYAPVLAELRAAGELSLETRRSLATVAFSTTAAYESAIARWFADVEAFPEQLVPSFSKVLDLSYGENPHQRGAFYAEAGARVHLLSRVEQLHGKELSYNNLNDLSAARLLAAEFTLPACVIVKHANPSGVGARGDDRRGLRQGARVRSHLGVRRRRRAQPAGVGRARRSAREAVRRGAARARLRRRGARGAEGEAGHADPARLRAPPCRPRRARLQARARRAARPGPRPRRRGPRGDGLRLRRPDRGAVGRPALRLAGVQARRLERDRASPRTSRPSASAPASSRASTPCASRSRRRASTATTSPAPRSPPTPSSRSPTARSSPRRGRDVDDPARRLEARRRGRRGGRRRQAR